MFQSIVSFLVIGSTWAFFQQLFQSGFTSAVSSTLQSTFGLTVSQATSLSTTYNVVKLLSSIPLSHFFMKKHVPRQCAWMCCLTGVGCILYGLPGLLVAMDEGDAGKQFPVCLINNSTIGSGCTSSGTESAGTGYLIMILSQVLNGFSSACLFQVVPAHINLNTPPALASRYVAIFYALGPAGLAVGYVLIGGFIKRGVYYIPFFGVGVCLMLLTVPFLMLPKKPKTFHFDKATIQPEQEHEGGKDTEQTDLPGAKFTLSELFAVAKTIVFNPVWLATCLASTAENFATQVYIVNGPQIMEVVYNVPRSTASFLSGLIVVPGAVIGTVIGGILGERGHKNLRDSALFNMKCAIISCTLLVGIFFFRCPLVKYNGLNYATSPPEVSEIPGCGASCTEPCKREYNPICLDGTTYYSPCHAGCTSWDTKGNVEGLEPEDLFDLYGQCACRDSNATLDAGDYVALDGICPEDKCGSLGPFLVLFFLGITFTLMNSTPSSLIMMRSVRKQDQAVSLGLLDFFQKILAAIPSPIFMSSLMDAACIVRNIALGCGDGDGGESCAIFDPERTMRAFSIFVTAAFKITSVFFCFQAYRLLKGSVLGEKPYTP